MEYKDEKLEKLTQLLKRTTPVLQDPITLTDSIMAEISKRPMLRVSPLLIWVRAALSSAAALLIGLFLFQKTEAENAVIASAQTPRIENAIHVDSTCVQALNKEHSNIVESYLCHMQQHAIENESLKKFTQQND